MAYWVRKDRLHCIYGELASNVLEKKVCNAAAVRVHAVKADKKLSCGEEQRTGRGR